MLQAYQTTRRWRGQQDSPSEPENVANPSEALLAVSHLYIPLGVPGSKEDAAGTSPCGMLPLWLQCSVRSEESEDSPVVSRPRAGSGKAGSPSERDRGCSLTELMFLCHSSQKPTLQKGSPHFLLSLRSWPALPPHTQGSRARFKQHRLEIQQQGKTTHQA